MSQPHLLVPPIWTVNAVLTGAMPTLILSSPGRYRFFNSQDSWSGGQLEVVKTTIWLLTPPFTSHVTSSLLVISFAQGLSFQVSKMEIITHPCKHIQKAWYRGTEEGHYTFLFCPLLLSSSRLPKASGLGLGYAGGDDQWLGSLPALTFK